MTMILYLLLKPFQHFSNRKKPQATADWRLDDLYNISPQREGRWSRFKSNMLNYCIFTFACQIFFVKTWIAWFAALTLWAMGGKAELPNADKPPPSMIQKAKVYLGDLEEKAATKIEAIKEKAADRMEQVREAPKKAIDKAKELGHAAKEKADDKIEEVEEKLDEKVTEIKQAVNPLAVTRREMPAALRPAKLGEKPRMPGLADSLKAAQEERGELAEQWRQKWEKEGPNGRCPRCGSPMRVSTHIDHGNCKCKRCGYICSPRNARRMGTPPCPSMPWNFRGWKSPDAKKSEVEE